MLRRPIKSLVHALGLLLTLWAAEAPLAVLMACTRDAGGMGVASAQHHSQGDDHQHRVAHLCCDLCAVAPLAAAARSAALSPSRPAGPPSLVALFRADPARGGLLESVALPPSIGPPRLRT